MILQTSHPAFCSWGDNIMKRNTRDSGDQGEEIAVAYLRSQGLTIIETQYHFGHGEIDIIAREGEALVFCEVKMRRSDKYGPPEYAVHRRKQTQIRKIAEAYLYEHEIREQICRFDVVGIEMIGGNLTIRHMRDAFREVY